MSNMIVEAVVGNIAGQLNPQTRMINEYIGKTMQQLDFELNETRMRQIELLQEKIGAATKADAKPSVIAAYERMLDNLTK